LSHICKQKSFLFSILQAIVLIYDHQSNTGIKNSFQHHLFSKTNVNCDCFLGNTGNISKVELLHLETGSKVIN
jgi:hypothetical protein